MGNFTEWFDYGVYAYTATYIANSFFPGDRLMENYSNLYCDLSAGSSGDHSATASAGARSSPSPS